MSHQVLARKYRPRCFDQVVGQTATLQALKNALDHQKLHHAYLLTGTRGVGKTSLARLFAKCLNCQSAISSTPCETCESCIAIRDNRFVDLIEIDAASRTRVEDMHTLLENIQYKPTMGRYKVYLIDEVHMLSTHSFNALLKTLEEPPSYIIFILATTDPNRLPNTILSRCLQFHLKNLSVKDITQQLSYVLQAENITHEKAALEHIAQVAEGSLRDALSLLEQVIMHGDVSQVHITDVEAILGRISAQDELSLIEAIYQRKPDKITHIIEKFSECNIDYDYALVSLLNRLHQIALKQIGLPSNASSAIDTFAQQINAEQIQLYYQIGLMGRRDLALAPTPKLGFEMTVLRMLAFQPTISNTKPSIPSLSDNITSQQSPVSHKPTPSQPEATYHHAKTEQKAQHTITSAPSPTKKTANEQYALDWAQLIQQLPIQGFLRSLALHCQLTRYQSNHIEVQLHPSQSILYNTQREKTLQAILTKHLNKNITLTISVGSEALVTPAALEADKLKANQQNAQNMVLQDPGVQAIIKQFDGVVMPDSVQLKTGDSNE